MSRFKEILFHLLYCALSDKITSLNLLHMEIGYRLRTHHVYTDEQITYLESLLFRARKNNDRRTEFAVLADLRYMTKVNEVLNAYKERGITTL